MIINDSKLKVAFLIDKAQFNMAFHSDDLNFFRTFSIFLNEGECPDKVDLEFMRKAIIGAEACITSWGTPMINSELLAKAASLKIIAHAAGTPKAIVAPDVFDKKIRIFTAAPIIAIRVAEATLGSMITMLRGIRNYDRELREGTWNNGPRNDNQRLPLKVLNYLLTVGIVSASHVGKNLIRILNPFGVKIKLYDPYVTEYEASNLGVQKVSLEELMSESDVITVHSPSIPMTNCIINRDMLALMKDGTIFINTARASVIDEAALIEELKTGRIYAHLDVFSTEPLSKDHILCKLNNVILTPHITGASAVKNAGYERGNYLIQQLFNYHTRGILQNETVKDMLEVMA